MATFLSTHIGSLPGASIEWALEHTFSFDIPCIFSLPSLDSNQLMIDHIFNDLNLGNKTAAGFEINTGRLIQNELSLLIPNLSEFISYSLNVEFSAIKYQLPSPYTLYSSIINKESLTLNAFCDFLLEKYIEVYEQLKNIFVNKDIYFFLDDPCFGFISESDDYDVLHAFISSFKKVFRNRDKLGFHCCSLVKDLSLLDRGGIDFLSLDSKFYFNHESPKLNLFNSFGIGDDYDEESIFKLIDQSRDYDYDLSLLTPPCGKALMTQKNCEDNLNKIKNIQSCLNS